MAVSDKPLAGKRVVVTRAPAQAEDLMRFLRDYGAEPVLVPMLEFAPPSDPDALPAAIQQIATFDMLIVTSANGANAVVGAMMLLEMDAGAFAGVEVLAVGPATALPLLCEHINAECPAGVGNAHQLFQAIVGRVQGKNILVVEAEDNDDLLSSSLRRVGANATAVDGYKSRIPLDADDTVRTLFTPQFNADVVTFASGKMGANFFHVLERNSLALPPETVTVAIGPETARHLQQIGKPPTRIARQTTAQALADACADAFR